MFDQEFTICNFLFNLEQKQNGCFLSLAFGYLCVFVLFPERKQNAGVASLL